jgi:RNA polymerase sigma-70 factor (sigma-E family)
VPARPVKNAAIGADRVLAIVGTDVGWGVMTNTWTPPGEPEAPAPSLVRRLDAAWSAERAPDAPAGRRTGEPARDHAVRALYERTHADMVRFAAFLTGDVDAAEDVAQEAFVRVFDAWDRIEDHGRVDAYLRATVVNVVRSNHRRHTVAGRHAAPHLTLVASAEDTAMGHVGRERVLAAIAALPLRQRACVVMRHWMRMTESEIATTLDLSVGSVRTHVKRGTETLKRTLGDIR